MLAFVARCEGWRLECGSCLVDASCGGAPVKPLFESGGRRFGAEEVWVTVGDAVLVTVVVDDGGGLPPSGMDALSRIRLRTEDKV